MSGPMSPAGGDQVVTTNTRAAHARSTYANLRWRARWLLDHVVQGDHLWGGVRWWGLAIAIVLAGYLSNRLEPVQPLEGLPVPAFPTLDAPTGDYLAWLVKLWAALIFSPPARRVWRHFLPAVLGWQMAVYVGRRFLDDLFELNDLPLAGKYLRAALFGKDYPSMTIADGGIVPADKAGTIARIGGPGRVTIQPGNAALFEHLTGPSNVLGAGGHFLRRFETLRDVVDLRDQFRTREEAKAITKDGIPVVVKDIQAQFRIRTGGKARTEQDPFPFLRGAVRRAVYGKSVGAKGSTPWADGVIGDVANTITGWIARRRIDDVLTPEDGAPRQQLHDHFLTPGVRGAFTGKGVEVLWVGIGHIQPDERVLQQHVDTWSASSKSLDQLTLAEGEAYGVRLAELARAEAQVTIINAIADALTSLDALPEVTPLDVILRRVAHVLQQAERQTRVAGELPAQVEPEAGTR